ncbi:MAG: ribonuclease H-like domain-containing protein [Candidatus Moranbacteria bacterium]|nr:ribonuclease H-like domain-containing protein [Candidatus Moranbacteria bacterium]
MSRVVVDIETADRVHFDELDSKAQESILRLAKTPEEAEAQKTRLNLWPVTGQIVAIGMLNPDTDRGVILYQNGEDASENDGHFSDNGVDYIPGDERKILQMFWEHMRSYDQVITFAGRNFDAPYLHLRSAMLDVSPTKNLMPNRYYSNVHCDLFDQLSFYGATRGFSLHFYTRAFGIASPKDEGVSGLEVPELFAQGEYEKIARYCARDISATAELFRRWDRYINIS